MSTRVSPFASFFYRCSDSCHLPPSPTVRNQFRSHCLLKLSLEGDFTPDITWCLVRAVVAETAVVEFAGRPICCPRAVLSLVGPHLSHFPSWARAHPLPRISGCTHMASQNLKLFSSHLYRPIPGLTPSRPTPGSPLPHPHSTGLRRTQDCGGRSTGPQ